MDAKSPKPALADDHARRVRALIVIVAAVFILAPIVVYLLSGRSSLPRQ
jgi:hypothetical protein